MNRLLVRRLSTGPAKAAGQKQEDEAVARLIKYIPAEVVSGYMLLSGIVQGAAATTQIEGRAEWGSDRPRAPPDLLCLWISGVGDPKGVRAVVAPADLDSLVRGVDLCARWTVHEGCAEASFAGFLTGRVQLGGRGGLDADGEAETGAASDLILVSHLMSGLQAAFKAK